MKYLGKRLLLDHGERRERLVRVIRISFILSSVGEIKGVWDELVTCDPLYMRKFFQCCVCSKVNIVDKNEFRCVYLYPVMFKIERKKSHVNYDKRIEMSLCFCVFFLCM